MSKKQSYILIFVVIIIIGVIFVLVKSFTIRPVNLDGMVATKGVSAISNAELAQNYQNALAAIIPRYRALLVSDDAANTATVRAELLALTVPASYRDAHARLVLLLDSLADGVPVETVSVSFVELARANAWLVNLMPDVQ